MYIYIYSIYGFRFLLDPHFDSVLVLLRSRSEVWASTMSKSVLMGRNNTMARDHTLRCFGRTLSHGEVNTPLPSIPTSVLQMMVEPILKLAMLRMTLILVKTEIPDQRKCDNFKLWSLRGLERRLCIRL